MEVKAFCLGMTPYHFAGNSKTPYLLNKGQRSSLLLRLLCGLITSIKRQMTATIPIMCIQQHNLKVVLPGE